MTAPRSPRELRRACRSILAEALAAANPGPLVRRHLRLRGPVLTVAGREIDVGHGRVALLAVGKAAGRMAAAAEAVLGDRLDQALVIDTARGPRLRRARLLLAAHPHPDERGLRAAREAEALARALGPHDLLLVLLSGGASALLPAPPAGISLADKAAAARLLMEAGADIRELNALRRHLSRLKGGGLLRAAAPARVACLALSDVVGDAPADIGSGPVSPDPTTFDDVLDACRARGVLARLPASVRRHLRAGAAGRVPETLRAGDPLLRLASHAVIGSGRLSLAQAARAARRLGLRPHVLTTRLTGEAREVGRVLGALLRECAESGRPFAPPLCLLACGETTVTVRGQGRGGRNQELALGAALALDGCAAHALAASLGTDGVDGHSPAAGGLADGSSAGRARALGRPVAKALATSDSHGLLARLGDALVTGPTHTNVADLVVLLAGVGYTARKSTLGGQRGSGRSRQRARKPGEWR